MLRIRRFIVFCVFAICVVTGLSFWVLGQTGADAGEALPPPRAEAKFEAAGGITPAVNIIRNADAEWLMGAAAQTGIPARALRAYAAAADAANHSAPVCGIGWNTVAAVGFVESAHGAYGGGSLNSAGQASGPLVGPSLDGTGFAAIADTDGGALDGDARWDRAVGPMQFIPSTWEIAGRDGNGDGTADPFNIDDAALSTAGYLCARGGDLTTASGWTRAIYGYNQSDSYVEQVRSLATSYAGKTGTSG